MPESTSTASRRGTSSSTARRRDRRDRANAIDDPAPRRRRLAVRNPLGGDTFGRGAEAFARFMGTPAFLVGMTVVCAVWLTWNSVMPVHLQFDQRATNFTLLTLILSLQASYAAPLLLLADNRQADRDRVQAEQDRQSNDRSHATTDFITREIASLRLAIGDVATRDFVRSEFRDLLEDLSDEDDGDAPRGQHGAQPSRPAAHVTVTPAPAEHATGTADHEVLRRILREEVQLALKERDR